MLRFTDLKTFASTLLGLPRKREDWNPTSFVAPGGGKREADSRNKLEAKKREQKEREHARRQEWLDDLARRAARPAAAARRHLSVLEIYRRRSAEASPSESHEPARARRPKTFSELVRNYYSPDAGGELIGSSPRGGAA